MRKLFSCGLLAVLLSLTNGPSLGETRVKTLTLHGDKTYQTIDGFGANVTPAQWRSGKLKPVLDQLVDDLGSTLIRFDCWGKADWLDPSRRGPDGRYPDSYLAEVYSGPVFRDAWEAFRYFNAKGIKPFFNVSGRAPAGLTAGDGRTLVDYDGYAEMVVTMLEWARNREKLEFSIFSPFNETDLGPPEGPRLAVDSCVAAARAVVKRMDARGFGDVKVLLMDDANPSSGYTPALLTAPDLMARMAAFATHRYFDGPDEGGSDRFRDRTDYDRLIETITPTRLPLWITEYGDLDQTEQVEFGVAWRSTRRLLKSLNEGASAGLVWDAFDNLHEHDAAWAVYGLFKTDRSNWTYTPKPRYYAAKQVYRFVRPGFRRVDIAGPDPDPNDVFANWHESNRHVLVSAFVSPDSRDFTIVGMSTVEADTELRIALNGLDPAALAKPVFYYRTSRHENCRKMADARIAGQEVRVVVPENSIFTMTTVK